LQLNDYDRYYLRVGDLEFVEGLVGREGKGKGKGKMKGEGEMGRGRGKRRVKWEGEMGRGRGRLLFFSFVLSAKKTGWTDHR
jgi:hypothetical protein